MKKHLQWPINQYYSCVILSLKSEEVRRRAQEGIICINLKIARESLLPVLQLPPEIDCILDRETSPNGVELL